ncbi:hypothetical protein CVIRNUC_002807 [Coccomyxa viridis]|uniref:Chlorophyllase n=1 Tax=Coccomyxa viridis TaxID=1274662 RepID=A0AAV1HXK7_9CHLO|nr:hypothetical protein CVIRNUC_002807 [Coccomyxa viridis]
MRYLTSSVAAFAALVAATGSSMARGCQYCSDGPCAPARSHGFSYQTAVSPGKNAELSLTVTLPGRSESIKRPFPVIFFFNGFQARSGFYKAYAERLASWGYVIVQYNLPLFWVIPDANEARYLDGLIEWLEKENQTSSSTLHGAVDTARIASAGHSRGAKLACLHFAGNSRVIAAYLIDPVDNTKYSPEGEEYPSGVKALKRVGKPVGITGAGIMGRCNPEGSNYKDFYVASAGKSWLTVVNSSSHTEFLDAGGFLNRVIAGLCGKSGRNSFQETLRLTAPALLAFMDSQLRTDDADAQQRVNDFYRFIDAEEAEDRVQFTIKAGATRGTDEQPHAEEAHQDKAQAASYQQPSKQELATAK